MTDPLKVGANLSSRDYDIDAISDDPLVVRGILASCACQAAAKGAVLPDSWDIEITTNEIITSRFNPDERVLRLEGVVTT